MKLKSSFLQLVKPFGSSTGMDQAAGKLPASGKRGGDAQPALAQAAILLKNSTYSGYVLVTGLRLRQETLKCMEILQSFFKITFRYTKNCLLIICSNKYRRSNPLEEVYLNR